jgi:hypothetical protein
MLSFLSALVLALAAPAATADDKVTTAPAAEMAPAAEAAQDEVAIATYSRSGRPGALKRELLRTTFDDGSPVKESRIIRRGGKYYLELTGGNPNACIVERVELSPSGGALRIKNTGAKASCSGDPCSACRFVETNDVVTGCSCADGTASGKCNHTISTGAAFSVLNVTAVRRQ